MIEVINIKDCVSGWKNNPEYIYCGRRGKGFAGDLGNPFPMHQEQQRDSCIAKHKNWLWNNWEKSTKIRTAIMSIINREKKGEMTYLVCFCAPKKCHADNIKELVLQLSMQNLDSTIESFDVFSLKI